MKKQLLLFILTLLPMLAMADDSGSCGKNVTYTYNSTTRALTIQGSGAIKDYSSSSSVPWYSYRTSIKTVIIEEGVTRIGERAFYSCFGLTSVTIGNSVASIGSYAFENCTRLTSITIPNSVTSIGERAFCDCSGLTFVTIGNGVTSIGERAFEYCSGLTSITVAQGNTKYDSRDNCNAIIESASNSLIAGCKTTIIPNSVASIGKWAFMGCSGLTSVTIPNSVTSIGNGAFWGCSGLTSVTIGNGVTSIGNSAFEGCFGLTSVTIGNSVASIGSYAFENCTRLTSITIPNSVMSIGDRAFSYCSGLTSVTIPNSVMSIGDRAFSYCSGLTSITVAQGNTKYDSRDNCNAIIESASNTLMAGCKTTIIPNTVTSIGQYAFRGCSGFTSVTIPNSVTSIGQYAFINCSGLTSVTIPNSVTSIGSGAFSGCTGLQKVIVPDIAAWYGISFADNSANPLYYAHHIYSDKNTEITEIVIPEGVNIIGQYAFYNCENITSVTIPSSVTSIGKNAFSCGIKLSTVNVNMNIPIEIDESVFEFTGENYSSDIIYLASTLNVPIGRKNVYSNVKGWSKFANIHEVDFTPIHKLTYLVDDEEYKVYEIAEGAEITPEPAPTKEGYTFSGWSEIPETMPAYDVTVTGTFSINKYKLTYKVDGVEYKSYELEYGATITPEPAPTKEGYTFSGWSEIPETMPAYDVTVTGSFAVNQYLITYMIGDEVYQKEYVDYGATIVLPNVPEREGYSFAWIDAPEKMPAHDITINGAYTSGILGVSNDDATTNTYTIGGYKTDKPRRGVNIIRMSDGTTRKVVVK